MCLMGRRELDQPRIIAVMGVTFAASDQRSCEILSAFELLPLGALSSAETGPNGLLSESGSNPGGSCRGGMGDEFLFGAMLFK